MSIGINLRGSIIMKKFLCSLLLLVSFSTLAETPSVQIGNGLGLEVNFDKFAVYVAKINSQEYTMHFGADYIFHKTRDFTVGMGGGLTSVVHDFSAVDGYTGSKDTETIPFAAVTIRGDFLFARILYADTDFRTERFKEVHHKLVSRVDTASGPEFGAFVGLSIPIR